MYKIKEYQRERRYRAYKKSIKENAVIISIILLTGFYFLGVASALYA